MKMNEKIKEIMDILRLGAYRYLSILSSLQHLKPEFTVLSKASLVDSCPLTLFLVHIFDS